MAECAPEEITGFSTDPSTQLIAVYQSIADEKMRELPFFHPSMPVHAALKLFEGQWVGCVLTPWMLSVVVLPGPDQCWPVREVGERLALKMPRGDMTFIIGELPEVGQLLSCSLMSPLDTALSAEQGMALVDDCLTMLFSLPVDQAGSRPPVSRRELFSRLRGQ
ncbi:hydrogenase-2 assembly chaperone [Enterobacillus tribolii]|uniref:Tat proofreading chaperone HybE n=1 Tax=Enterobacillus tribolii TaxID=1487935 RepID=A0A370R2H3_9GAMM|nr:hydrogenase-2 assembly chaperone [Enterobacillus tribolii]MBW7983675.1 hydrogenase-2 assembly chaperone [Enterobacillus tribolii]RDK96604.1 Tat proofreading chaperone HybE [Enterobacillus tribolii]